MTGIAGARQRQGSTLENKDFSSGQVWLVQAYSTKTKKTVLSKDIEAQNAKTIEKNTQKKNNIPEVLE